MHHFNFNNLNCQLYTLYILHVVIFVTYEVFIKLFAFKINKLIFQYLNCVILSLGVQPFMIQTGNFKSISGILAQNSKFNYTHLSGHMLEYSPLSNLALCTV